MSKFKDMRVLKSNRFRRIQEESPRKADALVRKGVFYKKPGARKATDVGGKKYIVKRTKVVRNINQLQSIE